MKSSSAAGRAALAQAILGALAHCRRLLPILLIFGVPAAAGDKCAVCHPKETAGYASSAMARSFGIPTATPPGDFKHALSGSIFKARSTGNGSVQMIERRGLSAQYPVAYEVGSGNHAFAYLIRMGNYLFQSPISYYKKRGVWDMAPGFEHDALPDFTRPVTAECLVCHAGGSFPVDGTVNRYQEPMVETTGVSCQRCHGPAEAHMKRPSRDNIVNPKRLTGSARDSICEQCHLSGEARVTNTGKKFGDFQAGHTLEEYFSIYVFDRPQTSGSGNSIKVVSHAEQLRRSACARNSDGRLWCGTCHDPHSQPLDVRSYYRERCLSCHGPQLASSHPSPADDCIGCHMPSRPAKDGGHTAFTDHRIARRPEEGTDSHTERLAAWRDPDRSIAQRNLGLAYLAVGERDRSWQNMEQGGSLLLSVQSEFADDPVVLSNLGVFYLGKQMNREALSAFQRALQRQPDCAPYYVNLALALVQVGKTGEAIVQLDRAIQLDPSLETAYRRLADIYAKEGNQAGLKWTFERYLQFRTQSLSAREALARH